jgi:hypothetical protein
VVWWLVVVLADLASNPISAGWGREEARRWKVQLCNAGIVPPIGQETAVQSITEVAYLQHSESVSWVQATVAVREIDSTDLARPLSNPCAGRTRPR